MTINKSAVAGNSAGTQFGNNFLGSGGGIYNLGVLTINNSTLAGNFGAADGGGIYNARDYSSGEVGTLTINNSTLFSNLSLAYDGGGIYNQGVLTINNSTFQENRTGGIDVGVGGAGGAIYNEGESVTINNSTFYRNVASSGVGAGGAIKNDFGALTINNSTLSDNSSYLGGIYNREDAVTTIKGTILKNTPLYYPLYYGITSLGYNLSNDSAGGLLTAIGDRINTDPMLDVRPLDNGGPTHTIALLPGSPAIDAGTDLTALNGAIDDMTTGVTVTDATGIVAGVGFAIQIDSEQMIVTAKTPFSNTLTVTRGANSTMPAAHSNGAAVNPAFDQRDSGFARKVGSAVDIGAFEVQASASPTPTPTASIYTYARTYSYIHADTEQANGDIYTNCNCDGYRNCRRLRRHRRLPPTPDSDRDCNTERLPPRQHQLLLLHMHAQIQQPIDADGTSVFNVKRGVIPVKFTLTLNGVATCALPPATIAVTRTAGGTIGPVGESVYSGPADNGSNFRIDSCQYVYNLSASALGVGTYRVDIIINTQVVGTASFGFR